MWKQISAAVFLASLLVGGSFALCWKFTAPPELHFSFHPAPQDAWTNYMDDSSPRSFDEARGTILISGRPGPVNAFADIYRQKSIHVVPQPVDLPGGSCAFAVWVDRTQPETGMLILALTEYSGRATCGESVPAGIREIVAQRVQRFR